ncbi:hypothetical protein [Calothrix sp. 336/3]|uniref:hypothetical protein n=1 Tax=Calothrix sp. 336/3 TaxID=1337936 RepID=UPI0004E4647A|nr:hypothetical protein [Calothrix sp. 336/3]AKG22630.1 hypothetical protein IJ00_16335 [Calothrix sp. 336/3]
MQLNYTKNLKSLCTKTILICFSLSVASPALAISKSDISPNINYRSGEISNMTLASDPPDRGTPPAPDGTGAK